MQCLDRIRREYNITDSRYCYTCRLDPMAQGVTTLLFGDAVSSSAAVNSSDKVYRFQAILGVSTTSYDPLGRITSARLVTDLEVARFARALTSLAGREVEQEIPPCSAIKYLGKPMWQHCKDGTLPANMPRRRVKIYSVRALQPPVMVDMDRYLCECISDIKDVMSLNSSADFQYREILQDWNSVQLGHVYRLVFEAKVSSGTYIRGLVNDIGASLDIPAHAFRITRGCEHPLTPEQETRETSLDR